MAKTFSLHAVLSLRQREVEILQMQLAGLLAAEQELTFSLRQVEHAERGLFVELARRQIGVLDLDAIDQVRWQLYSVQGQMRDYSQRIAEVRSQIEAKRCEILAAEQAKESLEKLKEREMTAWRAEAKRREEAERDDQYIARAYQMNRE